jgi:hypothetical protein
MLERDRGFDGLSGGDFVVANKASLGAAPCSLGRAKAQPLRWLAAGLHFEDYWKDEGALGRLFVDVAF